MHVHDLQSENQSQQSPQKSNLNEKYKIYDQNIQYFLDHHELDSIQDMIDIVLNAQLSQQFRIKFSQQNDQQKQFKISTRIKKLAVQHSYNQMYIYYQQFPTYLQQCKKVLRHKYQFDDILRTHQNRKSIWLLCSGAIFKMRQNPNFYQRLSIHRPFYPQFYKGTIQKDVVRTITDRTSTQSQQMLSSILCNFAIRNPFIGYCQGMNFIVNFLIIMQFNEEQIFWILTQLLEEYLPKSYYTDMMGIAVDIYIIQHYIKTKHTLLFQKLTAMGLSLSLFTLEWIVCLFTSTLPFYMLVIVWDMIFIYGPSILLKVCLVILIELQQTILNTEDLSQLLTLIQAKKKGIFIEEDDFIKRISNIYIDTYLLSVCRQLIELKLLKQKVQLNQSIKNTKKVIQPVQCDVKWPICFKALKQHKSDMGEIQVWIFKQDGPIKIINDYLLIKNKKSFKPVEDERSVDKRFLIGRIPHICNIQQYNRNQQIQKESIELEQYDLLNRRMLIGNLSSWTKKLQLDNEHLNFYRRATSSNLAFLQFSKIQNSAVENYGSPDKKQKSQSRLKDSSKFNVLGRLSKSVQQSVAEKKDLKPQKQLTSDSSFNQKNQSRNPFKKIKQKWIAERKTKKNKQKESLKNQ